MNEDHSTGDSQNDSGMTLEDALRQSWENVELFSSPDLADYIRKKHFDKGVSIFYIDEDDQDHITEERPDGTKIRRPILSSEDD